MNGLLDLLSKNNTPALVQVLCVWFIVGRLVTIYWQLLNIVYGVLDI